MRRVKYKIVGNRDGVPTVQECNARDGYRTKQDNRKSKVGNRNEVLTRVKIQRAKTKCI